MRDANDWLRIQSQNKQDGWNSSVGFFILDCKYYVLRCLQEKISRNLVLLLASSIVIFIYVLFGNKKTILISLYFHTKYVEWCYWCNIRTFNHCMILSLHTTHLSWLKWIERTQRGTMHVLLISDDSKQLCYQNQGSLWVFLVNHS